MGRITHGGLHGYLIAVDDDEDLITGMEVAFDEDEVDEEDDDEDPDIYWRHPTTGRIYETYHVELVAYDEPAVEEDDDDD